MQFQNQNKIDSHQEFTLPCLVKQDMEYVTIEKGLGQVQVKMGCLTQYNSKPDFDVLELH